MSSAEAGFVAAVQSMVARMLPGSPVVTGAITRVTIRGGSVTAVEVTDDDGEILPCDFTDQVAAAALAADIVGRDAVVLMAGAPLVVALYQISEDR